MAAQTRYAPPRGPVQRPGMPAAAAARLLGLQRLAGNRAVCAAVQRRSRVEDRLNNADDGHGLSSPTMAGEPQLEECFDGVRVLLQGARGPAITKLREALTQAGFPSSDPAESFGPTTTIAARDFQRTIGLGPAGQDGRVGKITIGHLDRVGSSGGPVQPDQDAAANDWEVVDTASGAADKPDNVYFTSDSAEPDAAELEKIRSMAARALSPSGPGDAAPPAPGPRPITLLGGASEEGSVAHNTELARRRMVRVSALLQQHGHPATLHTMENRAAEGVGRVAYAEQRSVRMVLGGVTPPPAQTCGEGPCSAEQKTVYESARSTAVEHVTRARGRLSTPAGRPHVDRLYRTNDSNRPATVAAIDRQMGLVLDQLSRIANESSGPRRTTPGFRCGDPCDCNAVAFNSDCRDAAGTRDLPGEMTLCPRFFTMAAPWQPLLLIHESHHGIAGEHSSDVAYNYTRLLTQLEAADALENANSFHALVRLLNGDIYDAITEEDSIGQVGRAADDHDSALDADPALAGAADRTLAVLEQWLTLADFDTGLAHAEVRESRRQGRPLDSRDIGILSHHFPISRNGQLATQQDQQRIAAIFDRMVRIGDAFDPTLTVGVGTGVDWEQGPGTRVTLPTSFAALPEPRRITALLQALVQATPNISAAVEPGYVGAIAAFANDRGTVGT